MKFEFNISRFLNSNYKAVNHCNCLNGFRSLLELND